MISYHSLWQEITRYRFNLFLIVLLAADIAFICLSLLYSLNYSDNVRLWLATERGYPEVYQYVKFFWTAVILCWFVVEKRQAIYVVGVLLFVYLLLDDSLKIHETTGGHIANLLGLKRVFVLRAKDFGEVITSILAGLFFLISGWWAYRRGDALARRIGLILLGGLIALAAVGIVADMLHQVAAVISPIIEIPFLILEDGGEMIVTSFICWIMYSLANQELSQLNNRPRVYRSEKERE